MAELCRQSDHSAWTMRRIIHYWLDHPPVERRDLSGHCHLVIDGTFLYGRRVGAAVFLDALTHDVVAGIYGMQEGEAAMIDVCRDLQRRGLEPVSATIDGNPQLAKMLCTVWPMIIMDRCLLHIQWQGQRWCRVKPKRPEAQSLRELFAQVIHLYTHADRDRFLAQWNAWEQHDGQRIAAAPRRGWVLSDLKGARSMLAKALPNMFHYLDHPQIPITTNAAEGYFGRLKRRYGQHRGLAPHRRNGYFAWYFHLCR